MLKKAVYVLDYELVSPIGTGIHELIGNIRNNTSADQPIRRFSTGGIPFKNAAEVTSDLTPFLSNESEKIKAICQADRMMELLAAAYNISAERLAPLMALFNPERTGVILGVGADVTPFELFEAEITAGIYENSNSVVELFTRLNKNQQRLNVVLNPYDLYAIYLANKFRAGAFQRSVLTACTSSTQALVMAYDSITTGEADVVIAGGTDSIVNALATIAFGKLGVIAETTNAESCKPFDKNRNGTLAAEAAGFCVLVSEDFMQQHQLKAKAQILGYGNTLDAYKITAPDPEGDSMTKAIEQALAESGVHPHEIDYINAHGTGTKHNDHLELKCIKRAFGEAALKIPISSTKSRHGHAIAAAGIQEFCLVLELMKNSILPGNLNMTSPCEPEMDLITENRKGKIDYAMTNNFAFGGVNTVLVVKNEMKS